MASYPWLEAKDPAPNEPGKTRVSCKGAPHEEPRTLSKEAEGFWRLSGIDGQRILKSIARRKPVLIGGEAAF